MTDRQHYSGGRFRKAIRHFLFGRAAQGITHFILVLWLVRALAPADFGAYMALWGLLELMAPLTSFGLLESVRRYLPELVAQGSSSGVQRFSRQVTILRWLALLLMGGALWSGWPLLAMQLGFSPAQTEAGRLMVPLIVIVLAFRFAVEMLETLLEQRFSQSTQALQPAIRLAGLGYFMFAAGEISIARMIVVDIIAGTVCLIVAEYFLVRRLRALEARGAREVSMSELLTFAWHMLGANLLQAAASPAAIRLIVVRLLGLESGGMFAFLQQLLQIVARYLPANLLANIIRPMLIARYQESRDSRVVSDATSLLWKSNLLIITTGAVALGAAGDELILLASGGRFASAGWIMLGLFVALGGTTQGQLLTQTFQIFDYGRQWRNLSVLALASPVLVWFAGALGLLEVALAMAVATWMRNLAALAWLRRQAVTVELDLAGALRILGSGAVLVGSACLLRPMIGPWGAMSVVLTLFIVATLVLRPLLEREVAVLARISRPLAALARRFMRHGVAV